MLPFRFLKNKKRNGLQLLLDDICITTSYPEKLTVKIYFFPGLMRGPPLAFCACSAKTIFMQNWLLDHADDELIKFILCHELGHIAHNHSNKYFGPCLAGEYEADSFAASIMGIEAGVSALKKTRGLIDMKYIACPPELLMPAFLEIDLRIRHLTPLA